MYEFKMPQTIQNLLDAEERRELPDAKQVIDNNILQTTQAPNPLQRNWQRAILDAKTAYDAAETDEQRQISADAANFLRDVAGNAGIDLSGYRSDVSLADARKNFASQEARDLINAYQGQYAQPSDQYYEEEYRNAIMSGLSSRRAGKLAAAKARQYQANRVAFLNGVYNTYGRDGYATNSYGNMALGALGQENPMLANYYSQIYPNAKDAYLRQNQLEDVALNQSNLLQTILEKFKLNELSADNAQVRTQQNAEHQAGLNRNTYAHNAAIDRQYKKDFEIFKANLKKEPSTVQKLLQEGLELASVNGLTGDDANVFAVQYSNSKMLGTPKESSQKDKISSLKTVYDSALKKLESLQKETEQYTKTLDEVPDELKQKIAAAQADVDNIYNELIKAEGLKPQSGGIQEYSETDEESNLATIAQFIYEAHRNDYTEEQLKAAIKNWMGGDYTDHFIDGLIKKSAAKYFK